MENKTVYIKPKRNAEVMKEDVFLKDIASLTCTDEPLLAKAKALKVYHFQDGGEKTSPAAMSWLWGNEE